MKIELVTQLGKLKLKVDELCDVLRDGLRCSFLDNPDLMIEQVKEDYGNFASLARDAIKSNCQYSQEVALQSLQSENDFVEGELESAKYFSKKNVAN